MKLPTVNEAELDGKRVLMRVDFNVVYNNGQPESTYKIKRTQKTIKVSLYRIVMFPYSPIQSRAGNIPYE